jgi:hypothetical protein
MKSQLEKYEAIMNIFKLGVDESFGREILQKPYNSKGKTMATNAQSMVILPQIEGYENSDRVGRVYHDDRNLRIEIPLADLKEAYSKCPVENVYGEIQSKCNACEGNGMVQFVFDFDHGKYYEDCGCPVCEGSGTKMVPSDKVIGQKPKAGFFIEIGNSFYAPQRIEEMIKVAELIEAPHVFLTYQKYENHAAIFEIGEAEMLVMPSARFDEYKIVTSLARYI